MFAQTNAPLIHVELGYRKAPQEPFPGVWRGLFVVTPARLRPQSTPRSEAWFLSCAPTPDLRQLPDPFYANDVTVWNLAPALPLARYARHVLVTVLHQLLRDHNVGGTAVRKPE